METKEYNQYITKIDKFSDYLDKPHFARDSEGKIQQFSLLKRIGLAVSRIFSHIARFFNYVFGDHNLYSETKAKSVIVYYINRVPATERTNEITGKILKVYEQLRWISDGKGTYADGIDISSLIPKKPIKPPKPITPPPTRLNAPKPKIDPNFLASNEPAENVGKTPDDEAMAHHFNLLAGLRAPDNRTLLHVHGNRFGQGSKLEGDNGLETMQYLHDYIKARNAQCPHPITARFSNDISKACQLEKELQKAIQAATSIKDGKIAAKSFVTLAADQLNDSFTQKESLLIPMGWKGSPSGHRCVMQVIPDSSGQATVRIYNSGSGINNHNSALHGNKIKYQPYVEWRGISKENLVNENLLHAIAEMNMYANFPNSPSKTNYGEKDIYVSLKNLLQPKSCDDGEKPKVLISEQTAGVCAMRAWFAVLRTYAEENGPEGKNFYKRLKCDLKIESLADWTSFNSKNYIYNPTISPDGQVELVQKSFQKTCRAIDRLYQKKQISNDYLNEAVNELSPIKKWIDSQKAQLQPNVGISNPQFQNYSSDLEWEPNVPSLLNSAANAASATVQSNCIEMIEACKKLPKEKPEKIADALSQAINLGNKAWEEGADQALYTGLLTFINELPTDDSFWQASGKNTKNEIKKLVSSLANIGQLFFKSCCTIADSEIILPERIQALHKIHVLQHKLLKALGCDINFDFDTGLHHLSGYIHTSKKDDIELKTTMGLSENNKSENEIKVHNLSADYYKNIEHHFHEKTTYPFIDFIKKEAPEVMADLSAKKGFNTMPAFSQEAEIYASPSIPTWIKALRDTNLYLYQMLHSFVGRPAKIDRKSDFTLKFNCEHDKKSSTVKISINNLDANLKNSSKVWNSVNSDHERYQFMHGNFSKKPVQKAFENILQYSRSEKNLLSHHEAVKGLSIEETQELKHIFTGSDLQIVELLEYFTKHTDKLKIKDYQIIFRIGLFRPELLNKALKKEGLADSLKNFIESNLSLWSAADEIQGCVFLLQCNRFLRNYDSKLFEDSLPKLRKLLARQGLSPEIKSTIYAEIVANLTNVDSSKLQSQDLVDLISGLAYLQENPLPKKWQEALTDNDVRKASMIHAKAIQEFVCNSKNPNKINLNKILNALYPSQTAVEWTLNQNANGTVQLISEDKRFTFRPIDCQFIDLEKKQVYLPVEIRQHPHFLSLFPGIELAERASENVFSFKDGKNRKTLVSINLIDGTLKIEQDIDGLQASFVAPETLLKQDRQGKKSHIISRAIVEEYSHWRLIDDPTRIIVRNLKTGIGEYQIRLKQKYSWSSSGDLKFDYLKSISNGLKLSSPSALFKNFEDPSYIHEWHNENEEVKKIELPRFSLSFSVDYGNIICDQFKGYKLSQNQNIAQLGSYQNYIVLENSKGEKKVILAKQNHFKPQENNFEILTAPLVVNRELDDGKLKPQSYLDYDFASNGKLIPKSLESTLYLVQVLTGKHKYEDAAEYLKNYGNKLSAYSEKEVEVLKQICNQKEISKDVDGNAIAIRTFAGYLLLKNGSLYKQSHKQIIKPLIENYEDYLNRIRNAVVIKLEPKDEIFLITNLLQKGFNPLLYLRLKDLDPEAAKSLDLPAKNMSTSNFDIEKNNSLPKPLTYYIFSNSKLVCTKPDLRDFLFTRLDSFLEEHFWQFYALALQGTAEEKKWLRDAIEFSLNKTGIHATMLVLLDHSSNFSMPPITHGNNLTRVEADILDEWRVKVRNKVEELLKKPKKNAESTSKTQKNLTPANFKLEADPCSTPPVNLNGFTMPSPDSAWKKIALQLFQEKKTTGPAVNAEFNAWLGENANTAKDSLQQQAYQQLHTDHNILKNQGNLPTYELANGISLVNVRTELEDGREEAAKQKRDLEIDILGRINQLPTSSHDADYQNLLTWSGKRHLITIEQAIVYFAKYKKHPDLLKQRNPALSDKEIVAIFNLVAKYLVLATHEQQRTRALDTVSKLEKLKSTVQPDPLAEQDLIQQLASDMMAQHRHDANSKDAAILPHFLAFEYFAGMLLRPEQVIKIEEFINGGSINIVIELLMGFGKSKVLMPLLAMLLDSPLLIVPPSLFENVSSDAQKVLRDTFGKMLHTLQFDRSFTFDENSLRTILRDIKSAKENSECLIMTSKSFQCLMLKFIEVFNNYSLDQDDLVKVEPGKILPVPAELKLMKEIINCFKSTRAVIDEADSVLNVLRKVCFSMGQTRQAAGHEARLISSIFSLLYKDPALKALGRLESDSNPDKNAPALTEELYYSSLQKPLVEKFIDLLPNIPLGSKEHEQAIKNYIPSLKDPNNRNKLMDYLCRNQNKRKEAQAYYDSQNANVQEILALAGQIFSQFLSHTLTRVSNEKYGIDKDSTSSIAVPFSAVNTPNRGSQFSNRNITMMYTFQAVNKNGITKTIIENEINKIQTEAMREMKNAGPKLALEKTKSWVRFQLLRGKVDIPLFNYKDSQLDAILASINADTDTKMAFVENIIIPQLELYEEQISCNPHNLISFLPQVSGFTGTLWNAKSMHRKITPKPAEGITAKTFDILYKKSRNDVVTVEEASTESMLRQLDGQNAKYDVIIDAGGYFKQGNNQEIARQIANYHNKHVVFYNHLGEQTITDGKNELPLSQSSVGEADRITFLDQDHTTGADVRYKRDAVAVMTISRKMLKRDVDQGSWRLRGLDKLQRINFVLSNDVSAIIKQANKNPANITFDHIAKFAIANQCYQQSQDNFQGFIQQLWDIPQQILMQALRSDKASIAECHQVFKELRSLWIKPGTASCRLMYGNMAAERPTTEIVDEEKEHCKKFLSALHTKLPWLDKQGIKLTDNLKEIEILHEHLKSSLPSHFLHPQLDCEQSMEVEQQVETEREVQLETQNEVQKGHMELAELNGFNFEDHDKLTKELIKNTWKLPRVPLKSYLQQRPEYEQIAEAFDDLSTSVNVFAWANKSDPSVNSLQLFGPYRTPLHFVLIENEKVTLLSKHDAYYYHDNKGMYNLSLGYTNQKIAATEEIKMKLVKIKFLNGDSYYNAEEIKLLEEWMKEYGPQKLIQLYTKHILAGFPDKSAAFFRSPLQELFSKLLAT